MFDSSTDRNELISVVIPTYQRPDLVRRAVLSVLNQTYEHFELLVVIDGTDPATVTALEPLNDFRLQIIETGTNNGPASARNLGVARSRGKWVALLDDDDEWLPKKLEKQVDTLRRDPQFTGLVATRAIMRTPHNDYLWPERPIADSEDVTDYLLDRPALLQRPGFIHPSSLIAPKRLFLNHPFQGGEDHEDWTFVIEACKLGHAKVLFVWEPLCIYYFDPAANTRSRKSRWQWSYTWAHKHRSLMTGSAFSAFMLSKVARKARLQKDWLALCRIMLAAIRKGSPRLRHFVSFLGICLLPGNLAGAAITKSYGRSVSKGA